MSSLDVADEMEYDERLALFRQTRLNPFDRGEEEDGPQGGKTPPQHGNVCQSFSQANWDTFISSAGYDPSLGSLSYLLFSSRIINIKPIALSLFHVHCNLLLKNQ